MSTTLSSNLIHNSLLQTLDPESLSVLLSEFGQMSFNSGDIIFNKGDDPRFYYVIKEGLVEINEGDVILTELHVGHGFGEMALLNSQPRTATAIAKTDVALITVSRAGFSKIMDADPTIATKLYERTQHQLQRSLLAMALDRLIGAVEPDIIREIEDKLVWETYKAGDIILEQGADGNDALIVTVGRVRASYNDGYRDRVLGEAGNGSLIGELALLSDLKRSATVTTVRETTLARMNRPTFEHLMSLSPVFVRRLMKLIFKRQQQNIDAHYIQKPHSLNFALVPTQRDVDLHSFAEALRPHLEKHGDVMVLDRKIFDDHYGVENAIERIPEIVLYQWLNELEKAYKYVVYLPDADWTDWTNWIMRHADRVLHIGHAEGQHQVGELEQAVFDHAREQRHELVLLHTPDTQQPSGTAKWLDVRYVNRHHHVRQADGAHYARLARLLTGNGIGLVLGGGGARGYAHIGVLKALTEAQIPIDALGCVSMGAVVGAGFLEGMRTPDAVSAVVEKSAQYGSKKALLDTTIPISAIMRSKKVSEAMRGVCGDLMIEDGWISFYSVSTNLSQTSLNVDRCGLLHKAVRASLSIPGVFSPVMRDGDLIVDGGVMNNFPVDIMREYLEGGTVIGTIVTSKGSTRPYDIDDEIDGTKAFFSRILPWMKKKRVPSIVKTILAASSVNAYRQQVQYRDRADFLMETDTTPYGTMDFDDVWSLVDIGYEAHREQALEWASEHQALIEQPPQWKVKVSDQVQ